jgi:hypothetical protein
MIVNDELEKCSEAIFYFIEDCFGIFAETETTKNPSLDNLPPVLDTVLGLPNIKQQCHPIKFAVH